jgi:hypothetical protein
MGGFAPSIVGVSMRSKVYRDQPVLYLTSVCAGTLGRRITSTSIATPTDPPFFDVAPPIFYYEIRDAVGAARRVSQSGVNEGLQRAGRQRLQGVRAPELRNESTHEYRKAARVLSSLPHICNAISRWQEKYSNTVKSICEE